MNVLYLSPGFPAEMPRFARGLATVGARVFGVGEQPPNLLDAQLQRSLSGYLQVRSLWDEQATIREIRKLDSDVGIDRVECLWEPGVLLAARLREALDLPGMRPDQALTFRDKERMKRALDDASIRTPRHQAAATEAECREAAEAIGYPLIVKPIAGSGSAEACTRMRSVVGVGWRTWKRAMPGTP